MRKSAVFLDTTYTAVLAASYVLSILITYLVFKTGGTPNAFAHLMYIPIALVSSIFGKKHGTIHALFSGLLLGPVINYGLHTSSAIALDANNWTVRVIIYAAIALIIGYFSDSSRQRNQYITDLLTHDNITNLKNLEAIKREDKLDQIKRTIVVVSVKNYEETLSFFGYNFGNQIVANFSKKLQKTLEHYKNIEIYRYGGMEFVLKITDGPDKSNVGEILMSVNKLDESILLVHKIPVYIELQMGIASHDGSVTILEALRHALITLRFAAVNEMKSKVYDANLESHYKSVVGVASSFASALTNHDIKSAYQYIYCVAEDKIQGVELLARWMKPNSTSIYPNIFVPILEKTELIHELTNFMTDEAIKFLSLEQNKNFNVSINFSAKDFSDKNIDVLLQKIDASGIDPKRFAIEITERMLVKVDDILHYLTLLNDYGISIAVDDFGTGYSSYQYIADMPIDLIKIDKSIIGKIGSSEVSRSMTRSIVSFCKENRITTLAEGVETKEIAEVCKEIGVDFIQGYYYHKPQLTANGHAECVCKEDREPTAP